MYSLFHRLSNWQRNEDCYPIRSRFLAQPARAKRRGILRARMCCVAAAMCFLFGQGFAASVGPAGYTNNFPAQPPAGGLGGMTIAGTGTDAYDTDADVNANVTTAVVTNQTIGAAQSAGR